MLRLEDTWGGSELRHGAEIKMLGVARDDRVIVAADGGQPGRAVVWDLVSGAERIAVTSRRRSLTACAITPAADRIAISGYDNCTVVFDARNGAQLHSFDSGAAAHALAFSPDGGWLLAGDDRVPRLFPLHGGSARALKGHSSAIKAAAFSPDGRYAATAAGDRKVKLQDVAKAKVVATMQGYASLVAFLGDGARLLYAGFDCGAIVEVPTGKLIRELELGYFDCSALSGNGARVVVKRGRHEKAEVKVLELATGATILEQTFDPVDLVALDSTGERLILARSAMLGQGTSLEVWSIPDGNRLHPRGEGHRGGVSALATFERGDHLLLVSASADRTLKIWDVDSGREIETIAGAEESIGALAISPDGRTAITTLGYGRRNRNLGAVPGRQ